MDPAAPSAPYGAPRTFPNRRTLVKGAAWAAPTLVVATAAPAMAASSPAGENCLPPGTLFDAQAMGRLLSGAIGGLDLDNVAEVGGVHARAFDPAAPEADGTDHDVDANPLDVGVLNTLNLSLGGLTGAVSSILDLVTGQELGVVNQYAEASAAAEDSGTGDIGAAGTVSDNGTLELATGGEKPPSLGTLNLKSVLEQATGLPGVSALLASVADLTLDIGALGGRSAVDTLCIVPPADVVNRDYVLAYVKLDAESDVVGDVLGALETLLPQLTISTDAVWDLLNEVPLLGPLLSALGKNALNVEATVDLSQLTGPVPDDANAALQLHLGEGRIGIDVASLLGGAYEGNTSEWLNTRGPNTRLFVDAGLPGDAVTGLLDTWVDSLLDRLKDLVSVKVSAGSTSGILATGLLIEGSLRDFLEGGATAKFVLAGVPVNLGNLLNPLLGGIGELVEGTLSTLLDDGQVLATALDGVNGLLSGLFDVLSGAVAITLNAQNNADGGTMPAYYQAITDPGRFDAAALHVEVLGVANLLNLSLGRGIYGPKTARSNAKTGGGLLPF